MNDVRTDTVESLYRATETPRLVRVPPLKFLCLDGRGGPDSPEFAGAVQALYTLSYGAKFALKKAGGPVYRVSPLEGLFWAEDPAVFIRGDKSAWGWRLMIRQPDEVDGELVGRVAEEASRKRGIAALVDVRLVTWEEGPAAQVLHVGPYAAEGPTIARLHAFLAEQGLVFDGRRHRHHEIYLGDPRRAAPEKLRTIIRQSYAG
ncbi:GyrI-like domain-containing protein [Nocardioides islandensis]|uniref:GyrI-like domain-containing protein n=1 Tax=Nocardioides islandensis TaxID=433663 RepID=A0A930YLX7_9ACTN|nr:GyrI-like domain-containing protein [Nocardioides islandensis]MBF4765045.1 GyrI-like domain-containing protein [Nocardioides islandensis]